MSNQVNWSERIAVHSSNMLRVLLVCEHLSHAGGYVLNANLPWSRVTRLNLTQSERVFCSVAYSVQRQPLKMQPIINEMTSRAVTHVVVILLIEWLWSTLGDVFVQNQLTISNVFKCGNISLCYSSQPYKSFRVRSKGQCVNECQHQQQPQPCIGVNYRETNGVCDIFIGNLEANYFVKNEIGCQYFQVTLKLVLSASQVLIDCNDLFDNMTNNRKRLSVD